MRDRFWIIDDRRIPVSQLSIPEIHRALIIVDRVEIGGDLTREALRERLLIELVVRRL